jgi:hypothetical protein
MSVRSVAAKNSKQVSENLNGYDHLKQLEVEENQRCQPFSGSNVQTVDSKKPEIQISEKLFGLDLVTQLRCSYNISTPVRNISENVPFFYTNVQTTVESKPLTVPPLHVCYRTRYSSYFRPCDEITQLMTPTEFVYFSHTREGTFTFMKRGKFIKWLICGDKGNRGDYTYHGRAYRYPVVNIEDKEEEGKDSEEDEEVGEIKKFKDSIKWKKGVKKMRVDEEESVSEEKNVWSESENDDLSSEEENENEYEVLAKMKRKKMFVGKESKDNYSDVGKDDESNEMGLYKYYCW